MAEPQVDETWMWHPHFSEERKDTAGLLVHFRREFTIEGEPPTSLPIEITADTRYKLYVNQQLVSFGPVKGDSSLWFYDEIDIGPWLKQGHNQIAVIVLRYFYSTQYATSFPRLPSGGLRVFLPGPPGLWHELVQSSPSWETAIDPSTTLRVDEPEDDFLHIYENVCKVDDKPWDWVPAKLLSYQISTGNSSPWNLSPRLIPRMRCEKATFSSVHSLRSCVPQIAWETQLIGIPASLEGREGLRLPPGTNHHIDLEVPKHLTGFVCFRFKRPASPGSTLKVTYAESYEDTPRLIPYLRRKGSRRDHSKALIGPQDIYHFEGMKPVPTAGHYNKENADENFAPFHFRTFRFLRISIEVGESELILEDFGITAANYPLDIQARFNVSGGSDNTPHELWETSIRTLVNCMHDCYEDCPFYEQLQYAMDTRSSALFTYYVSGDDRLARQAMIQIHNSFQARLGLTGSRAPSHRPQIIPHFSLFWVNMLSDHLTFFGDRTFLAPFIPAVDAVLNYFHSRLDPKYGLVLSESRAGIWNYVDWADQWRPFGIPPAAERSGISTYTNHLYAYTLKNAAALLVAMGRSSLAEEYICRAGDVVQALQSHCFDGKFFTDSLASGADTNADYSQHNQVWAVLSGAVTSEAGQELLRKSLNPEAKNAFIPASISMSFYTLRALSKVGGDVYDEHFHQFWDPWRVQISLGLTTWEEDSVSQRSDCHAWGSAPIHEFMAEVAGIRPKGPGWKAITFQPRLALYKELEATVPLPMVNGKTTGAAHVAWKTTVEGNIVVSLRVELVKPAVIPVYVTLPKSPCLLMDSTDDLTFIVKSGRCLPE